MTISQRLLDERAFVEQTLAQSVICARCGTTLREYADRCAADLADACEGFLAIEKAKAAFTLREPK